jgi:hypothetical protein
MHSSIMGHSPKTGSVLENGLVFTDFQWDFPLGRKVGYPDTWQLYFRVRNPAG